MSYIEKKKKKKKKKRRYNHETSEFVLYPNQPEEIVWTNCFQRQHFKNNLQIICGYKLKDSPFSNMFISSYHNRIFD